jgi:signal transduction histidine kinase
MSLRTRLILTHFFIILLTLTVIAVSLVVILRQYQVSIQRARLGDAVVPLAFQARAMFQNNVPPREALARLEQQAGNVGHVMIITEKGLVLADAANGLTDQTVRINGPVRQQDYIWGEHQVRTKEGVRTLLFAAIPAGQISRQNVYVALAQFEAPFLGVLDEIGLSLLFAGGTTLLVSLLVALLLARSIARPITQLTRATEAIAHGQYDHRVDDRGSDEIGRLAQSFNSMAEQVQRSRQMEKDFVANVSHELKTPLTSVQGFAQAILDGAAAYLLRLVHRLIHFTRPGSCGIS